MTEPEMTPAGGDQSVAGANEKKKRSRVKQLLSDIKKQVEFWFGDVNLHKDRFLKQLIVESRDGYVDMSVLTSFNRMKKLTTDVKLIARALKNSLVVEVNLEGTKVRRQNPIGETPKDVDARTVYVELLPRDVQHGWIERVFSKCGSVVYVSIPRYKTTGHAKGFAFVEFEKEEQAQAAIELLNNPPEDAPRKPGIFPKTKNGKPLPRPPTENTAQGEAEEQTKKKKKKSGTGAKGTAPVKMPGHTSEQTGQTLDQTIGMVVESSQRKRKRPEEKLEGESASRQKNSEKASLEKKPIMADAQKTPEMANLEKKPKMADTQQNHEIVNLEKKPKMADTQKNPEIVILEKNSEMADAQNNPEIVSLEKNPEMADAQKNPEIVRLEKNPEPADTQKNPEIVSLEKNPEMANLEKPKMADTQKRKMASVEKNPEKGHLEKKPKMADTQKTKKASLEKNPGEVPQIDKKRRRSRAAEGSENNGQEEMPAKIRRTVGVGEGEESSKKKDDHDQKDMIVEEVNKDKEDEKGEDSLLKAKRKRKKKNKERLKLGEEVVPLRVISKRDWLALKEEYMVLQRQSMASLKKCMTKIHQRGQETHLFQQGQTDRQNGGKEERPDKENPPQGPSFEAGVIVKITHTKPLPERKVIKEILSEVSPVVYIDVLQGDVEGYVRFKTPEDATAVVGANAELQKKHNWQLAILSGDHEQRYWQKILVDRQVKLNRPRDKRRGTEKLISKAQKIVIARAKEASKHLRFLED